MANRHTKQLCVCTPGRFFFGSFLQLYTGWQFGKLRWKSARVRHAIQFDFLVIFVVVAFGMQIMPSNSSSVDDIYCSFMGEHIASMNMVCLFGFFGLIVEGFSRFLSVSLALQPFKFHICKVYWFVVCVLVIFAWKRRSESISTMQNVSILRLVDVKCKKSKEAI